MDHDQLALSKPADLDLQCFYKKGTNPSSARQGLIQ